MKSCEEFEELMCAYADGELDDKQKVLLEQHVAGCPHCAALLSEYLALNQALAQCTQRAPEDICDKVMTAIREEKAAPVQKARGQALGRLATWLGVGFAAVLCVSVATTALVKHMALGAGNGPQTESVPGLEQDRETEPENWGDGCIPDATVTQDQMEEAPDNVGDSAEMDGVEDATESPSDEQAESAQPEYSAPADTAVDDEGVSQDRNEEAESDHEPSTPYPDQATQEECTDEAAENAPSDTEAGVPDHENSPSEDASGQSESSSRGWLGRTFDAIGSFFERIWQGIVSLFTGGRDD